MAFVVSKSGPASQESGESKTKLIPLSCDNFEQSCTSVARKLTLPIVPAVT